MQTPRDTWPDVTTFPAWLPAEIPDRLANVLRPFTPAEDGWYRRYRGGTRYACGTRVPLEQVDDKWSAKKAKLDAALGTDAAEAARRAKVGPLYREATARFFAYLDHRVRTGQPEAMSPVTAEDYKRTLFAFGRVILSDGDFAGAKVADRPIRSLQQPEFAAFAKTFDGRAPSTFARNVAYVRAFMRFCKDEGLVDELPQYGRYFVPPSQQRHRDVRLSQKKSFAPAEMLKLLRHSTTEERAWLGLALSGAMDNSDIANLTFDVIDRDDLLIDYRRRKRGKVQRLIPIHPRALRWLDKYLARRPRPADPAHAELVFLTPTGLPLKRMNPGKHGLSNSIDYVAMCWGRLMVRAGIRTAPPKRDRRQAREPRAKRKKGEGPGDGRGFRSIRTTFPNRAGRGWRDEVELVMGHAGGVLLENYVEEYGVEPLRELVEHVFHGAFTSRPRPGRGSHTSEGSAGGGGAGAPASPGAPAERRPRRAS
jgi:integrase